MILTLAGQSSDCLICAAEKFLVSSTGFELMTSAMQMHVKIIASIIPFTRTHEPNKLTCLHLSEFIAQLVRALHRHRRGHRFESC